MHAGSRRGFEFHHPLRTVTVGEGERAHISTLTSAIVGWVIDTESTVGNVSLLVNDAPQALENPEDLDLALGGYREFGRQTLEWDGNATDVVDLRCNTMSATGSTLFAIMARLDAFCDERVL